MLITPALNKDDALKLSNKDEFTNIDYNIKKLLEQRKKDQYENLKQMSLINTKGVFIAKTEFELNEEQELEE